MSIDAFFRANYQRMVGYCSSFGYDRADAEEEVVDVILRHHDEYIAKANGTPAARSWMNRRVLFNLRSRNAKHRRRATETFGDAHPDTAHFDDPESILCAKQRLPEPSEFLINYESHAGGQRTRGTNSSADRSRYCRERKRFAAAMQGVAA